MKNIAIAVLCTLALTACGQSAQTPSEGQAIETGSATKALEGSGAYVEEAQAEQGTPAESPAPPAPATVTGEELAQIMAQHEGKVIVLNFWATWCPPCVEEMPHFVDFYNETNRDKLALVSLSADDPAATKTAVSAFQQKHGLPFPIHVLDEESPEAFYEAVRTELSGALPTTLVYDQNGKIVKHWEGAITLDQLQDATKPLTTS